MAHFMVRYYFSLLRTQDPVFLFLAYQNHFHRFQKVLLGNRAAPVLNCKNSGLVDHIGKIRTHRA